MNNETLSPKSALDATVNMLNQAQLVTVSRRLITNGALLGACIVFLSAMMGLPHLDTPLHIALLAFAVALPCLAVAFTIGLYRFKSAPVTEALAFTALIADGIGGFAASLGILTVLAHFHVVAMIVVILTIGALLGIFFLATAAFERHDAREAANARDTPPQHTVSRTDV